MNLVPSPPTALVKIGAIRAEIEAAQTPEELRQIDSKLDGFEAYMRQSGTFADNEMREIIECRMLARWKLGKLLAKVERGKPGPKDKGGVRPQFKTFIEDLGLEPTAAKEIQRIGAMPEKELTKFLDRSRDNEELPTFTGLLKEARPYWYQESRQKKHQTIAAQTAKSPDKQFGPFPLIYADPPWKFEIYSEKGLERTPDQHYPTLTDDEIIAFKIGVTKLVDLIARDAALLLWCTSSNLVRAIAIMDAWGFTYKTHAVWDKEKSGLGLVFRNQHEVLLYGTRGKMPGPQFQPRSVFRYPRGRHSAKPPEIRAAIEKMYPDFDERTRLELFARTTETVKGWTCVGNEATS